MSQPFLHFLSGIFIWPVAIIKLLSTSEGRSNFINDIETGWSGSNLMVDSLDMNNDVFFFIKLQHNIKDDYLKTSDSSKK